MEGPCLLSSPASRCGKGTMGPSVQACGEELEHLPHFVRRSKCGRTYFQESGVGAQHCSSKESKGEHPSVCVASCSSGSLRWHLLSDIASSDGNTPGDLMLILSDSGDPPSIITEQPCDCHLMKDFGFGFFYWLGWFVLAFNDAQSAGSFKCD